MGEGWQLLRIRGIPLRIHPSWFLILALATVAFQQQYSQQFAAQTQEAWLWLIGLLTALLLARVALLAALLLRRRARVDVDPPLAQTFDGGRGLAHFLDHDLKILDRRLCGGDALGEGIDAIPSLSALDLWARRE